MKLINYYSNEQGQERRITENYNDMLNMPDQVDKADIHPTERGTV